LLDGVPAAITAEARTATMRFVATFLEVSAGFRPVAHLRMHCRPDRYQRITDHLRGRPATRSSPAVRGAAAFTGRALVVGRMMSGGPTRTRHSSTERLILRRVQICQVSENVAEVVVILSRGEATAAMALRLERTNSRWFCVHLEIV
jgi:hypothetical protein